MPPRSSPLPIRWEQIHALRQDPIEKFIVREAPSLCEQKEAVNSEEDAQQLLRQAIDKGRNYGLDGRDDVWFICDMILQDGPDFDEREDLAWMRALLDNEHIPKWATVMRIKAQFPSA